MIDAERLAELAARRGTSESAAVREAVETALFAEEFAAAMEALRASGYGSDDPLLSDDETEQPEPAKRPARAS